MNFLEDGDDDADENLEEIRLIAIIIIIIQSVYINKLSIQNFI